MSFTIGREKTFLDSNILIYLLGRDELKNDKITLLLDPNFIISSNLSVLSYFRKICIMV